MSSLFYVLVFNNMFPYITNKDFCELCRYILLAAFCLYKLTNRTGINVSCQQTMTIVTIGLLTCCLQSLLMRVDFNKNV